MRAKFLNPDEIEDALLEISELAAQSGVALELLGSDRLTKDVDFICSDLLPHITVKKSLTFGGISGLTQHNHRVDLIVRNDEYTELYQEALAKASFSSDLPVRVVAPEYLVAMKMAAGRDKDELDLKTLIRLEAFNLPKTLDVINRHLGRYAVQEFKSLLSEVAWLKTKE
jgi:hypothetical protein